MNLEYGLGSILYGRAGVESLSPSEMAGAQSERLHPFSLVAVRWFTFLYFPLVPLGTYRVFKSSLLSPNLPITPWPRSLAHLGSAVQATNSRVERASWRWDLVLLHYIVAWGSAYALFHLGSWVVPS